ncbi:MAG: sulfatase-like hydrolase/transferase [Cyclobacteriaceae bacterium]|nr:sulfatase-like hydrolase/transferase [Cyclobacteriaceae bacterium]
MLSCGPRKFERPNIIIIMADDLGYGDIGCFGNTAIETPALDRLAAAGMKLTNYHANGPVCTPTRAALLTGRYQQRSGLEGVIYAKGETRSSGLALEETTFAEYIKQAGYTTGIIGKWHLGYQIEYNPVNQGFDVFRGYVSGNIDYHSHIDGAGIPDWWHNLEKTHEEGYVTDLVNQHALEFIQNNKDKAFCLFISHEAPHFPFQGRNDKADRYPGGRFPAEGSTTDKAKAYKEMIEIMDEGVGQVHQLLENYGLLDKTLILFCSDNGGLKSVADNGTLRGAKGSLWEGGLRVPAIAHWQDHIPAGTVNDELVMSMDLFPTIANLSKTKDPSLPPMDGTDITRMLIEGKALENRTVFWRYRNQKAAINMPWKLIIVQDTLHLYNLNEDISELKDLAETESSIANQLKSELEKWEQNIAWGTKLQTE